VNEFLKELEKHLETLKNLFYNSRQFTLALICFVVLFTIAFPQLMMLLFATTVVFIFIKGLILILEMINNR
jgi:hypothetical protein